MNASRRSVPGSSSCTRALLLGGGCALAFATSAGAQLVSTVDIGAASLRYENAYTVNAMSLTPSLEYERGPAWLQATGTLSRFETGELSSSGSLFSSLLSRPLAVRDRALHGEATFEVAGSAHEDETRAFQLVSQVRVHLTVDRGGLWVGGGGGRSRNDDAWRTLALGEAGAWWRRGSLLLSAVASPARAGDTSWTDLGGHARWTRGALQAGGSLGARVGGPAADDGAWATLHGAYWITRRIAVNAAVGSYRADHARGAPGGRYVSIGLRLASRPPVLDVVDLPSHPPVALTRSVAGRITVLGADPARRTIRIEAAGARRVELMGDFTEWRVVLLEPNARGSWEITLPLAAGTHRFNVRVDGGAWGIPTGVTALTDDFGGVVGILVVR